MKVLLKSGDVLKNCRLCQKFPGVFKLDSKEKLISCMFEYLKIVVNDETMFLLPQSICITCKNYLDDFNNFLQQIQSIDQHLKYLLKINRHPNSEDKNNGIYVCSKCPASLNSPSSLTEHEESHKIKSNYKCSVCSKTYNRIQNFEKHKQQHAELFCKNCQIFKIENDFHICNVTSKACENSSIESHEVKTAGLKSHEVLTVPAYKRNNTEREHHVTETQEHGSDSETPLMIDETKAKEKSQEQFICNRDGCGKICKTLYILKTHKFKHEGRRPFLCVTCGKNFITKNSLTCHEKIHSDIKAYVCKLCNIEFSVRSNLRSHEKKYHEGIKFYCSQCTRSFLNKCSLERHEKTHLGIKEFKCASCKAAFYTNKELLKHQKYHQGLRQHKCEHCFKTFFEKHHLIIHLRIHSGEKPYICTISDCRKSFTESQKLKKHQCTKHAQNK